MSNEKNKRVEPSDAVQMIASQGREILKEGNRRRIIARDPDGKVLLDVSATTAVVTILLVVLFMPTPFGWLLAAGGAFYGISKKVKIDFVREIGEGDDNATISAASKTSTKAKASRLETPDSSSSTGIEGDTLIDDESAKPKRRRGQDN